MVDKKGPMAKAGALFDKILDAFVRFVAVILIFSWLLTCTDVIMRYFLNRPLFWSTEINEYILAATGFLGAAWLLKQEGHVAIDMVPNLLSPKNRAILNTVTSIIGAVTCIVITWFGVQATWNEYLGGIRTSKALMWPSAPFIALVPLSFFLLFIQFLRRTWGSWVAIKKPAKQDEAPKLLEA